MTAIIFINSDLVLKKQYPKCLENEKLPLMQSAITELVQRILFLPDERPAKLIAEYTCPADWVETQAMIEFFEAEIPSVIRMSFQADHGELSACFDGVPYQREDVYRNSTPLQNTTERRLAALACMYFSYRNFQHKITLTPSEQEEMDPNSQEYYDFFGRIPGITMISPCIATEDCRLCHQITFEKWAWYKTIDPDTTLMGDPKKVLRFLQKKGYKKCEKPAVGCVVVYHIPSKVRHYGKIAEIDSDGQIMVISKFGYAHIYKHRIELTQFHYGNAVTFLKEPKKP
jgi:hypothetical protein